MCLILEVKFGDVPEGDNNDATGFFCLFFLQLTCVFNAVKTERKMKRKEMDKWFGI